MKVALFGDIHGNAAALEAVLSDMEAQAVDERICLGDIAFRGPQPEAALERVFAAGLDACIVGNTDQWLVRGFPPGFAPPEPKKKRLEDFLAWARERIDAGSLRRLGELPFDTEVRIGGHRIRVVHSSPRSTEDWYDPSLGDEEMLRIFDGAGPCDILVYGHVHTPMVRRIRRRWLVNTGSVGNPIDGDARASYALIEAERGRLSIQIRRVPYDVGAVIEAARSRDFPCGNEYAEAIRSGNAIP